MNATETTIIQIPYSEKAVGFALRYCDFYEKSSFFTTDDMVIVVTHNSDIDLTQSVFWPYEEE